MESTINSMQCNYNRHINVYRGIYKNYPLGKLNNEIFSYKFNLQYKF